MKIGIQWFNSDYSIAPAQLAKEIEDRGFDALVVTEHTHIPAGNARMTEASGGQAPPDYYRHSLDPFVALSYASAATTRLRIGTAVCLLAERDAIVTAKAIASLDHLSQGRFIFGVGFGWNADEAAHHGVDWKTRFSLVREKVAAMKELWTHDLASYEGEFVKFSDSWSWPKPRQNPHPPVWVGGVGQTTMRHAAEWADVWFPYSGPDDPTLERVLPKFRGILDEAGRDPASIPIVAATAPADARVLDRFREEGLAGAMLALYPKGTDESLRDLDALAAIRDAVD
jgi:probable F420-dependent oxidoreductase